VTLLAAYNFDEASGAVIDVTGNAHDITLTGTSTRDPVGHTSKGLKQTTSETSTTLTPFGQTANRTIMAWIKSAAAVADGRFFEFVDTTPESTWEFLFRDTAWHLQAWNASTFGRATTTRPTDGLWHHFAGTYDGTNLRLYKDGVLAATTALTAPLRTTATVINVMNATSTDMVFDDVRLYDAALDITTINTLMGTPVGASTTPVTATRATTWRVLASPTGTRSTTWRVVARTTGSRSTTWDVLTPVTASRSTTWRTAARVTGSRATTWRVRAVVTASRSTTWAVASTLASVTASRSTTWVVDARVTSARSTTWDTLSLLTNTRSTTWDVLALRTSTRATTWRVRAQVSASRATTWEVFSNVVARDLTLVGVVESNHWTGSLEANRWAADIEPNRWEGTVPWPEL
jgi:hypothetical protein